MLVGVIHPQVLEVYSYDGRTHRTHSTNEHHTKWSKSGISAAFDYILNEIGFYFDVIIILDSPTPDIAELKKVVDKHAKHVSVHPLIAGLLTEFINNHFTEDVAAHVEKTFAVVVDGRGFDYYKFGLLGSKHFRLLRAENRTSSNEMKVDVDVPVSPECVLVANIDHLMENRRGVFLPKNSKVMLRRHDVKNFYMESVYGGIKMAQAKCSETPFYIIEDFCDKMIVSMGGITATVAPCGVPFGRQCRTARHFNGGDIKVYTSKNISFKVYWDGTISNMKRYRYTLFNETGFRSCYATLWTDIDEFGLVTFKLDVPVMARKPTTPTRIVNLKQIFPGRKTDGRYCEEIYATVFLSHELVMVDEDGKVTVTKHPYLEAPAGQLVDAKVVRKYYTEFFKHVPILDYKVFILAHDGTYPAPLVKVAIDVAEETFSISGLGVVSPQTLMQFHSARKTPFVVDLTKVYYNLAMFITKGMFNVLYTRYNVKGNLYEAVDTWQAEFKDTAAVVELIASAMHDGPMATYATMTLYADDIKPYERYCAQVGVQCKQLPSLWFEHNLIHLAGHFNKLVYHNLEWHLSNGVYIEETSNPAIKVRFDDSFEEVFLKRTEYWARVVRTLILPKDVQKLEFFQEVSHINGPKFSLFKTNIKRGTKRVKVTLTFDCGIPHITTSLKQPKHEYVALVDLLA